MYKGKLVIDMHGHLSTPPHFRAHALNLVALRTPGDALLLPEAAMKAAQDRHLKMLDERNIDVQFISPRPVAMLHWERPFIVHDWTKVTNNIIADNCRAYPKRFAGIAQLPQTRFEGCAHCVAEMRRCVEELGFVGALVNPDPGADGQTPGMDDAYWYPLYEAAEKLNCTLVVHPSISRDPRIEKIPHSYQFNNLSEETLATMLLENSDVFERFPKLRIVICHCGGALRRLLEADDQVDAVAAAHGRDNRVTKSGQQAGGQVGLATKEKDVIRRDLSQNLFFDTCAYDPYLLSGAIHQRGPDRMVFGTEVPGSGSALLNPQTNKPSDDVLAMLESFDFLTDDDRLKIVHDNPRRMFPLFQDSRL